MFRFLGTSAGEQYPGVWCNCSYCAESRRLGGRNIRRNSAAHIAPNILIDFPPSIPDQAREWGVSLPDIEHLLVTHVHEDHFCPWYLRWRYLPKDRVLPPKGTEMGPLFSRPKPLQLYGNKSVIDKARAWVGDDEKAHGLKLHLVAPDVRVDADGFSFVPVLANHDLAKQSLNYVIFIRGKTILYATDTAWFLPETLDILAQFRYDIVVMDGTFGFNDSYDTSGPGHSNFHVNRQALELFQRQGLLNVGAKFVVTHTGPHHAPPHDSTAPLLAKWGLTLAFDGMEIEL